MSQSRFKNRILARIFTAFPSLAARWGESLAPDQDAIPWTVPKKPLREAVVALVTTGGVHLKTQEPFDMSNPDGDPSCREIPVDTPGGELAITHDYYDHRDAERDLELVFPVRRLQDLVDKGIL